MTASSLRHLLCFVLCCCLLAACGDDGSDTQTTALNDITGGQANTDVVEASDSGANDASIDSEVGSQPFVRLDLDGVLVEFDDPVVEVTGERPNRTFRIRVGPQPGAWHFEMQESFIGFVDGLNVGLHEDTMPNVMSFDDNEGRLSTSTTPSPGIDLFFEKLQAEPGGQVVGRFSGTISDGTRSLRVENGRFETVLPSE